MILKLNFVEFLKKVSTQEKLLDDILYTSLRSTLPFVTVFNVVNV